MVCDVLGSPVSVSTVPGASGLGAAICAGVGAGVFADLPHGAEALVHLRHLVPDTERARTYGELYSAGSTCSRCARPPTPSPRTSPCRR